LLVGWDANVAAENAISVEVPAEDEAWVAVEIPLERARFAGGVRAESTSSWQLRDASMRRGLRAPT
jgi:hypothetical protein